MKDASERVKEAVKVTIKKLPRTSDNAWGLDRWEVGIVVLNQKQLLTVKTDTFA